MAQDGLLTLSIGTADLQSAITGLDGLKKSLTDMASIAAQMEGHSDQVIQELQEATPVGDDSRNPVHMRDEWLADNANFGGGELEILIGNTSPHASFVIRGTGLWGPNRSEIVAGNVFVFFSRGQMWQLQSHRGQSPNEALNAVMDSIPTKFIRASGRVLRGLVARFTTQVNKPFLSPAEIADVNEAEFGSAFNPQGLSDIEDF